MKHIAPFAGPDRELLARIWSLTWPMLVFQALERIVSLVDLVLVRPFGSAATAAVSVGAQVTFLVEAIVVTITAGAITLMSQSVGAAAKGEGEFGATFFAPSVVVRQSLYLALLLAVPLALAGYLLSEPLLRVMQASPTTIIYGIPYLHIYFAGLLFTVVNLVAVALFRGAGQGKTPMKLALGMSVLQVSLNVLLIHGAGPLPALGVPGAALGGVAARAGATAAYLYLLWRSSGPLQLRATESAASQPHGWFGLDWSLLSKLLRVGVPMALANFLRHGSRVVFFAMVGASALGEALQAAVGVGLQIRLIGVLIALAFQTATATLVGQAIGRDNTAEAEALVCRSLQLLAVLMLAITLAIMLGADHLADLFIGDPVVAVLAAKVLRWFAVAQLFSALSIGLQGALMGGGDTLPAMYYTLISEWCLLLPISGLLIWLDWGPDALLLAWAMAPALTLLLMQRRFRGGRWKSCATTSNPFRL